MFYTGRKGSTVWLLIDYTQHEYIFFFKLGVVRLI